MLLRIDAHTHPFEAMRTMPTVASVGRIVAMAKRRGLNAIAVTEHEDVNYGWKAHLIAKRYYPDILVIPGVERAYGEFHVVELYFPDHGCFRILAHPHRDPAGRIPVPIHAVEVHNGARGEIPLGHELARRYGWLPFRTSDAHRLEDIGRAYTEIELHEILVRI